MNSNINFHDHLVCEDLVHLLPWFLVFGTFLSTMMTFCAYVMSTFNNNKIA